MNELTKNTMGSLRTKSFFGLLNKLMLSTYRMSTLKAANFVLKHKLTNPAGRTQRKSRTTGNKMYGTSIYQDNASYWGAPDSPAKKKLEKRFKAGLCLGCGNKPVECRCKRKNA